MSGVPPCLLLSPELPPGAPAETFPAASTHRVLPDLSAHGQLDADRLVRPPRRSVGRTSTRGRLGAAALEEAGSADLTLEHVERKAGGTRGGLEETEKETSGQPGLPLRLPGGRPALLAEPSSRAGAVEGPGGPESPSPPDRTSQGSVCPGKAHRFMASPLPIRLLPQRPRSQTAIPAISPPTSLLSTKELRDFLKASTEQRQTFG